MFVDPTTLNLSKITVTELLLHLLMKAPATVCHVLTCTHASKEALIEAIIRCARPIVKGYVTHQPSSFCRRVANIRFLLQAAGIDSKVSYGVLQSLFEQYLESDLAPDDLPPAIEYDTVEHCLRPIDDPKLSDHLDQILDGGIYRRPNALPKSEYRGLFFRESKATQPIRIPNPDGWVFYGDSSCCQYDVAERPTSDIEVRQSDLLRSAMSFDLIQRQRHVPEEKREHLLTRVRKIRIETLAGKLLDGDHDPVWFTWHKDKRRLHLAGMPSSGKSPLVMALVTFLVTECHLKIAMICRDTISAAQSAALYESIGITSVVLSSTKNRHDYLSRALANQLHEATRYLNNDCLLWSHILTGSNKDKITANDIDAMKPWFSPAGDKRRPCDKLLTDKTKSKKGMAVCLCPYLLVCPVHLQERRWRSASLTLITPQSLLTRKPPNHLYTWNLSQYEMLCHETDLVITDEADMIMQIFDSLFFLEGALIDPSAFVTSLNASAKIKLAINKQGGGQLDDPGADHLERIEAAMHEDARQIIQLGHYDKNMFDQHFKKTMFSAETVLYELLSELPGDIESTQLIALLLSFKETQYAHEPDPEEPARSDASHPLLEMARALSDDIDTFRIESTRGRLGRPPSGREIILGIIQTGKLRGLMDARAYPFDDFFDNLSGATRDSKISEMIRRALVAGLLERIRIAYLEFINYGIYAGHQFGINAQDLGDFAFASFRHPALITMTPQLLYRPTIGFQWKEEKVDNRMQQSLQLYNQIGIGRYLLLRMHETLTPEYGDAANLLLLSATSYAGGSVTYPDEWKSPRQIAAPQIDIHAHVPVDFILKQPEQEITNIQRSLFHFQPTKAHTSDLEPISISGAPLNKRIDLLKILSQTFLGRLGSIWRDCEQTWGADLMVDRRRAMIVVPSFDVAKELALRLRQPELPKGVTEIYDVQPDKKARCDGGIGISQISQFGRTPEGSVLIAPITPISRGHNILNSHYQAALSVIGFAYRPHQHPKDMSDVHGALSRLHLNLVDRLEDRNLPEQFLNCVREAQHNKSRLFADRKPFSRQQAYMKRQSAWWANPLILQTISRGVRAGVPVSAHFLDAKFEEMLPYMITVIEEAMCDEHDREVVTQLYSTMLSALQRINE